MARCPHGLRLQVQGCSHSVAKSVPSSQCSQIDQDAFGETQGCCHKIGQLLQAQDRGSLVERIPHETSRGAYQDSEGSPKSHALGKPTQRSQQACLAEEGASEECYARVGVASERNWTTQGGKSTHGKHVGVKDGRDWGAEEKLEVEHGRSLHEKGAE